MHKVFPFDKQSLGAYEKVGGFILAAIGAYGTKLVIDAIDMANLQSLIKGCGLKNAPYRGEWRLLKETKAWKEALREEDFLTRAARTSKYRAMILGGTAAMTIGEYLYTDGDISRSDLPTNLAFIGALAAVFWDLFIAPERLAYLDNVNPLSPLCSEMERIVKRADAEHKNFVEDSKKPPVSEFSAPQVMDEAFANPGYSQGWRTVALGALSIAAVKMASALESAWAYFNSSAPVFLIVPEYIFDDFLRRGRDGVI